MSVRPSVLTEQLYSHWTDFHEILNVIIFRAHVEKIEVSLESDKKNGYFIWRPLDILLSYVAYFFLEWEIFQTKVVEETKTQVLCSTTFFFSPKIVPFMR